MIENLKTPLIIISSGVAFLLVSLGIGILQGQVEAKLEAGVNIDLKPEIHIHQNKE